jgi:predicted site-specific integrase-resolvase
MDTKTCTCECDKTCGQTRLLDQKKAAELLAVKPRTLEYWRINGGGPVYVKIGKMVRYRESDVYAYIEQLRQ